MEKHLPTHVPSQRPAYIVVSKTFEASRHSQNPSSGARSVIAALSRCILGSNWGRMQPRALKKVHRSAASFGHEAPGRW